MRGGSGRETGGAFDVTIGPLVNLWGFGPADSAVVPSKAEQELAYAVVGMDKIELRDDAWRKLAPEVYVDLSALAKGFAVDEIGRLLKASGCRSFLVDVGGEVTVNGHNARRGALAHRNRKSAPRPRRRGAARRRADRHERCDLGRLP